MNYRLTWKINGDDYSLAVHTYSETDRTALDHLLAGLVMTGHHARLEREQPPRWEPVG